MTFQQDSKGLFIFLISLPGRIIAFCRYRSQIHVCFRITEIVAKSLYFNHGIAFDLFREHNNLCFLFCILHTV